jgi:hypothetical protein
MKGNEYSQMLFEISIKVNGNSEKCGNVNIAFRHCIHKLGVNIDSDKGTKTDTVYKFFGK